MNDDDISSALPPIGEGARRAGLTRRRLLQAGGGLIAAQVTAPMWLRVGSALASAPAADTAAGGRKLLVLLFEGGNDGLNTLIPYGMGAYYDRRRTIAHPAASVKKLAGSTQVGLHPNLAALHKAFARGEVAIVQGVGYDDADLSHFGSMDVWQTASPTHSTRTGWLGRYLDATPDGGALIRAAAISYQLPPALVGDTDSGVAIPSIGGFGFLDGSDDDPEAHRVHEAFLATLAGARPDPVATALVDTCRDMVGAVRAVKALDDLAALPTATLADRVALGMRLLSSSLGTQVVFVSVGGFDTHAVERAVHDNLMADVDQAVARFHQEAVATGDASPYLMVTFSEFGRRVEESGSGGTDHGTAAPMFAIGTGVRGGLYGQHPDLQRTALDENGNLVRAVDFREVYASLVENWLGGATAAAVLGGSFTPVPFLL